VNYKLVTRTISSVNSFFRYGLMILSVNPYLVGLALLTAYRDLLRLRMQVKATKQLTGLQNGKDTLCL